MPVIKMTYRRTLCSSLKTSRTSPSKATTALGSGKKIDFDHSLSLAYDEFDEFISSHYFLQRQGRKFARYTIRWMKFLHPTGSPAPDTGPGWKKPKALNTTASTVFPQVTFRSVALTRWSNCSISPLFPTNPGHNPRMIDPPCLIAFYP